MGLALFIQQAADVQQADVVGRIAPPVRGQFQLNWSYKPNF